jgi:hypothetical protein
VSCPQDLVMTARAIGGKTMVLFQNEGPCVLNDGTDRMLFENRSVTDLFGQPAGDWVMFISNTGAAQNFTRSDGRPASALLTVTSSGTIRMFTKCG